MITKIKTAAIAANSTKTAIAAKGTLGVVLLEEVHKVEIPDIGQIEGIMKLVLQIIVSATTLWSIIKKPKPRNS